MLRQLAEFGKFVQKERIQDVEAIILVELRRGGTQRNNGQFVVSDIHFIKENAEDDKAFSELSSSMQDYIKRKNYYVTGKDVFSAPNNSAIGSSSGLLTYAPHAFLLGKRTIEEFHKKKGIHVEALKKLKSLKDKSLKLSPEKAGMQAGGLTKYLEKSEGELAGVNGVNIVSLVSDSLGLFWREILEKHGGDLKRIEKEHKGDYVILLYPGAEEIQEMLFEINREYLDSKLYPENKDKDLKNVACISCGSNEKETYGLLYKITNDQDKIYLRNKTRYSVREDKVDIYCCKDCTDALSAFKGFCREKKIAILPLFRDSRDIERRRELFLQGATFHDFFEELLKEYQIDLSKAQSTEVDKSLEELSNRRVDFYLYADRSSEKYISYDYVTNYKWILQEPYQDFFSDLRRAGFSTLKELETKMRSQLSLDGKKRFHSYFSRSSKDMNVLEQKFANKLFYFIYHGKSRFELQDFLEIVSTKIEYLVRNQAGDQYFYWNVLGALNLFYNGNLYINNSGVDESMSTFLAKVRSKKEKIRSNADESIDIETDKEWAYWAGQLVYYLLSLSESGGSESTEDGKTYRTQDYGLLERFTNKASIDQVKYMIVEFFENYKHEIDMRYQRFNMLACDVLAYKSSSDNSESSSDNSESSSDDFESSSDSFLQLKVYFYTGVFDNFKGSKSIVWRK